MGMVELWYMGEGGCALHMHLGWLLFLRLPFKAGHHQSRDGWLSNWAHSRPKTIPSSLGWVPVHTAGPGRFLRWKLGLPRAVWGTLSPRTCSLLLLLGMNTIPAKAHPTALYSSLTLAGAAFCRLLIPRDGQWKPVHVESRGEEGTSRSVFFSCTNVPFLSLRHCHFNRNKNPVPLLMQ